MIELESEAIAISRQCELLGLSRSSFYYKPAGESELNLKLMRLIDQQYMRRPYYGVPRMTVWLQDKGYSVNHKRVQRLMRQMGLQAVGPKPNTSKKTEVSKKYPYLLRGVEIDYPNQVWSTDITYVPMNKGYVYLVAVMDWYSRYVLSWELSNSLDTWFCLVALDTALQLATPQIFNSDQGSQFTSDAFTKRLLDANIDISWDGKGRVFDNIFIERLWRTVKYEEVYLNDYQSVPQAYHMLNQYFMFYNTQRRHMALGRITPQQAYLHSPNSHKTVGQ